ncbi:MAG: hypothetical protein A2498_05975 [Lentisphaerae bacterium RIFOXYC12_FULL_60_16]|nr:MAG: hypothetical protein A2498_05975 [Lentisphaerae bacterium RIFOXYC12_FULL_60_16]
MIKDVVIREYRPEQDVPAVAVLWESTLGATYPVSSRVLYSRIGYRPGVETGDGWVAERSGRVVGFILADHDQTAQGVSYGMVSTILVHPDCQRQGIGTRLYRQVEQRLCAMGCTEVHATAGWFRFWSGVPADLPDAVAFFQRQGFGLETETHDLIAPLDGPGRLPDPVNLPAGFTFGSLQAQDLGALFAFQQMEFAGWVPSMLKILAEGDGANILVLKQDVTVVGSIQTYTPSSKWRGPNVVWERLLGECLGGYGCVGVARAFRGQGLGLALCVGAMHHIARNGGTCCLIDWTNLLEFYKKTGAVDWRCYKRGSKRLVKE